MELAAAARRDIFALWQRVSDDETMTSTLQQQPQQQQQTNGNTPEGEHEKAHQQQNNTTRQGSDDTDAARLASVAELLRKYRIDPTAPRDEDVCRGLGDALDRLLLLCVPLSRDGDASALETVLYVAARLGRRLSIRTVQHLFARTSSYAEALAVFYALRRCHVAMNMEVYHAMLYSLQRLEEEGWAQRFADDYRAALDRRDGSSSSSSDGAQEPVVVSEQALDFVLHGIDNALMPENKPWLGRIMFAETPPNAAAARQTRESFDEMGKLWVQRYRDGGTPHA